MSHQSFNSEAQFYNRKNENYQKLKTKRAFCSLSF